MSFFSTSPYRIFLAIGAGIVAGLIFGEYCKILEPIGEIYVMMLQSVIYPYLISTLVMGFGRMNREVTFRFFKNVWGIYLLIIGSSFVVLITLAGTLPQISSSIIPEQQGGSIHTLVQKFLQILIPENPAEAVVRNFIPAVVIISMLYGFALQEIKNKAPQIAFFDFISTTSLKIWKWVILFSPIGIFALTADVAGTIDLTRLEDVSFYLILFYIGALFLTFCFLPLLILSLIPLSYRELFRGLQNALLISCATGLSVAAIPFLQQMGRKLMEKYHIPHSEGEEVLQTSLSISYPFCQLGNNFILLFIFFALFYFHRELDRGEKISLPFLTFFASIGTPSTSINGVAILSEFITLPKDSVSLYVFFMPITRFAQVLVSVMGMATFTFLSTWIFFHTSKYRLRFVFLSLGSIVVFVALFFSFGKVVPKFFEPKLDNLMNFRLDSSLTQRVNAKVDKINQTIPLAAPIIPKSFLNRIKERGTLRVGYNADMIPWCYFNRFEELVGYDVAFMYQLAKDLDVDLHFIPFEWFELLECITKQQFDIAIGSIYVTGERLQVAAFTQPYDGFKSSLMVRNEIVSQFTTVEDIRNISGLKIGVLQDPVTLAIAERNFPKGDIVIVPNYLTLPKQIDAAVWTKGHTDAWVTVHPGYTSLIPRGLQEGWPLEIAFMTNQYARDLVDFVNYWMGLQNDNGFTEEQHREWILRLPLRQKKPRWSVIQALSI